MSSSSSQIGKELYEFGPFRVDPEKQMLLRDGKPIALTPKAFQLLLVLVRRSNQIVSKDDLMNAVWPDTFVEETNLTRNIFALRRAMGESERDRYIITVPGHGYRFAEHVRPVAEEERRIVAATYSKVQVRIAETKPRRWVVVSVILLFTLAIASYRFLTRRAPLLTEKDTVVLADFSNSTGDPVFDETLRQGMAAQLEQSPFLTLISEDRMQRTLKMMGQPAGAPITRETAREVCQRTGSAAVLEGSIASLGNEYVLGLRATNCRTGDVLDEEQSQAAKKEDVLQALSQLATKFRTRIGESRETIRRYDTPLEAATPSLEALKAYSTGWKLVYSSGAAPALPFFKRAVELDPNFAMAHAVVGRMYADLDESDLSAGSTAKAWQLRGRASERERFFITAEYESLVTGNVEKARQAGEEWEQTYPRDSWPHFLLSGSVLKTVGQYERAIAEARRGLDLDPDFVFGYYNLAINHLYLNRVDDAENTVHRAAERGLESDELVRLRYDIAFLKDDQRGMQDAIALARERSGGENWISSRESFALAYRGHVKQARITSLVAVEQAQQAGQRERAGLWDAGAAVREALFGNASEANRLATGALELSKDREVEYGTALVFAVSGDSSRAQGLANDLEKRFPEDTAVRFSYLPVLRATLALNQRDPAEALELLQAAAAHELGVPRSSMHALFGALYPVYVRGEAYLAAGQGSEAVAEFQKILDRRGIVLSDPIGALAHLQLGRAYSLSGDTSRAKSAYQDFLTLWKDGDPDIPMLTQARTEYARLQ
jgi:DNA-binding winged helix-turn-helix (wHTH) protein/tetratricopeptide (TPR) repeat protein